MRIGILLLGLVVSGYAKQFGPMAVDTGNNVAFPARVVGANMVPTATTWAGLAALEPALPGALAVVLGGLPSAQNPGPVLARRGPVAWHICGGDSVALDYVLSNITPAISTGAIAIPTSFSALDFSSHYKLSPGNLGNTICGSSVVGEGVSTDTGGGCNLGWLDISDWFQYSITSPATRSYAITARLATQASNSKFQLAIDGTPLDTITATVSGWQNWFDNNGGSASLPAGSHTLRATLISGSANVRSFAVR
jgi:hypothetical protein